MHPVSVTIVNMSLTVSQYHLTLKQSSSVSKHTLCYGSFQVVTSVVVLFVLCLGV